MLLWDRCSYNGKPSRLREDDVQVPVADGKALSTLMFELSLKG